MKVLLVGIQGVTNVEEFSWEEINKGRIPNVSDYDIVLINLENDENKTYKKILKPNKIIEVVKGNTQLFLFGSTNFYEIFPPNSIEVSTVKEIGTHIDLKNEYFEPIVNIVGKEYKILFEIKNSVERRLIFDIKPILTNRVGRYIAVYIERLRPVYQSGFTVRYGESLGSGKIYFMPPLGSNIRQGAEIILKNILRIESKREKPDWVGKVTIKKLGHIQEEITDLKKAKKV